jgi:hypothetical protein
MLTSFGFSPGPGWLRRTCHNVDEARKSPAEFRDTRSTGPQISSVPLASSSPHTIKESRVQFARATELSGRN